MKIKIVLLLSFIFLGFFCSLHADEWKNVCVKLNDGSELTFALNSTPRFWFMSEWMYVSVGRISTEFTTSDVKSVNYIDKVSTEVKPLQYDSNAMNVIVRDEMVFVRGLKEHSILKLYSLDGKQVESISTSGTEAKINIQQLTAGIYILQVNKMSVKIIKQ
jgi:hypothetical protein